MKRILFIILFIAESLCFYAIGNNELFVQSIKQKDYSSSLELADNAAYCLRPLIYGKISWDEYIGLMVHADSIQHPYRDSLIINGINYLAYYGMKRTEEGQFDKAISLQEVALSLTSFVQDGIDDLIMGINNQLAINHGQLAQYDKAIAYSQNAYEYAIR